MRKLIVLLIGVYALFFLSRENMLPSITELKSMLNITGTQQTNPSNQQAASPSPVGESQPTADLPTKTQQTNSPVQAPADPKYPPVKIQTYQVSVANGKIIVTGKPTPYGEYNHADGVILYIDEQRANKKVTVKVPFNNETVYYEYPLAYTVGEVVVNLDEYYNGQKNDPNKVLGYAQYQLTDGNPYLLPSYMVQSSDPTLMALAQNITSGKQTDAEKSRAIFDWVAKNIAYNAPLVNDPNPPLYSAMETYQNRVVLCSGYADLSAALHRAVGIQAKVDYGENHAWNEVLLNGVWHLEDPTYGSGFINANTGRFVHSFQPAYFTKTDKHKEGEYPW